MTETIKYPYDLILQYQVTESPFVPELEYITVRAYENTSGDIFDDSIVSDKNYLELNIKRVVFDPNKEYSDDHIADILDSDDEYMFYAFQELVLAKNEAFLKQVLDNDAPEVINHYLYLDSAVMYGDFSTKSLQAAIAKAFHLLTKISAHQEWVGVTYLESTISREHDEISFSNEQSLAEFQPVGFQPWADDSHIKIQVISGKQLNRDLLVDETLISNEDIQEPVNKRPKLVVIPGGKHK